MLPRTENEKRRRGGGDDGVVVGTLCGVFGGKLASLEVPKFLSRSIEN